jgi:cholinesterase
MHNATMKPISQIIAFGDSRSDIGQGYVDGNGPTAIACMAYRLGLQMIPGRAASLDLRISRCYAVSGGGSGDASGGGLKAAMFGRGVLAQISDFEDAIRSKFTSVDSDTLFFIAIGLNDRGLASEEITTNYQIAIDRLYALGARRLVLSRLPAISPPYAEFADRINSLLSDIVEWGTSKHADCKIHLSRFDEYFDDIRAYPNAHGLENAADPCAPGRAVFGEETARCGEPEKYFYYHPDHPSAVVHALVGAKLAQECVGVFGPQNA